MTYTTFMVIGDTSYSGTAAAALDEYMNSVPQDAQFVVHLGDIWSGKQTSPALSGYQSVANTLLQSSKPVFIVPGDNEYNDTSNPTLAYQNWTTTFNHFDQNWTHDFEVNRQVGREENFSFVSNGVLYMGINLVGGRIYDTQEWANRSADDLAWIESNLAQCKDQVSCAVIFAQAAPSYRGYSAFESGFVAAAQDFSSPILYLQGDLHNWRMDNPYASAPNITRGVIAATGSGADSKPLMVTVTNDPAHPFAFDHGFPSNAPTITGTDAADVLIGLGGANTIHGLGGNDILDGGGGADTLYGGDGNDILIGGGGIPDYLDGGSGINTASYATSTAAVNINIATNIHTGGHATGDTLVNIQNVIGSAYSDTLIGDAQDNVIEGGSGNDVLDGDAGNDVLNGGTADSDTASYAGAATGVTVSLAISGQQNTEGAGFDTLIDIENLTGSSNSDTLTGNTGSNILTSGAGDDVLTGDTGSDTLNGGPGNDTYSFGLADGNDTINEAGGADDRITILTSGNALTDLNFRDNNKGTNNGNLVMTYNGQQITIFNHFDNTNENIEWINFTDGSFAGYQFGTVDYAISAADPANSGTPSARTVTAASGNNLLAGECGANRLNGGAGSDLLFGAAGKDILNGGAGADLLVGGTGADTINGEADNDVIVVDIDNGNAGADVIAGGADTDTLAIIDTGTSGETLTVAYNGARIAQIQGSGSIADDIERVTADLGAGTDTLAYTTTSAVTVNLALGTASGFISIAGIENVTGGTGADTLISGLGNNMLNGAAGSDTYVVNDTGDLISESGGTGGGVDLVQSLAINYTISDVDVENLTFIGAGDFVGTGNSSDNVITGGAGNDTLTGGAGVDTLICGFGNDTIIFDDGDTGIGANRDVIVGFTTGSIINLQAIDANTTVGGGGGDGQTFSFIGTAAFSDTTSGATLAAGQVRFQLFDADRNGSLESTLIQGNVNNTLTADFEILLQDYMGTLTPSNFGL